LWEIWGGVRLRSKGLRTQATGKLPTQRGRMGSSRRQRKLVFYVMLKFPLSSLVSPGRCMNTSAPTPRNINLRVVLFNLHLLCLYLCFIKKSSSAGKYIAFFSTYLQNSSLSFFLWIFLLVKVDWRSGQIPKSFWEDPLGC